MLKALSIFVILLALAIYSVSAQAAPPARACARLLAIDDSAYVAINDFLVSKKRKNQLMDQSIHSARMRELILDYGELLETLYNEQFSQIVYGQKKYYPAQALGFKSTSDLRKMKEELLQTQIELLATIDQQYINSKFKEELFIFTERVFNSEVTKYELLLMQLSIKNTLKYYSRM